MTIQPPILMNRFMINLRSAADPRHNQPTSSFHPTRMSMPEFRAATHNSFLGNIGEEIITGDEDSDLGFDDQEDDFELSPVAMDEGLSQYGAV